MKFAKSFRPWLAGSLLLASLILPVAAKTVPTLKVANVQQLLQALGPDRTIQLQPGIYHLSPELATTPYAGPKAPGLATLLIRNVKNLSLIGSDPQRTRLVSTRCKGDVLDFAASSAVRMQGIGFGRMSPGDDQELDCSPDPRAAAVAAPAFVPDPAKVADWQRLAKDIARQRSRGLELSSYTEALYPGLLEQVKAQTLPLDESLDPLKERLHSIRPRLGAGYQLQGKRILKSQQPAQAAAMVFDRSQNLLAVLDARAQVILAVEGRNNTRQSWHHPAEWLMQNSMVPQSNAPAPNGVYAFGELIKDSPTASHSFGSYRIIIEGGVLTQREILFHSRDNSLSREIPWKQDLDDEETRTLGCFLFQDPDLNLIAQLLLDAKAPVALAVQGAYAKNLASPAL